MTFDLHVDGPRWRAHNESVRDSVAAAVAPAGALVPVMKGNGYGFGNACLAREALRLGATTIAVGTVEEVPEVAQHSGQADILVLAPYELRDRQAAPAWAEALDGPCRARLIATISTPDALIDVARNESGPRRIVLESLTSMRRFGLSDVEIATGLRDPAVRQAVRDQRVRVEGLALHLPLSQPEARRAPTAEHMLHDAQAGVATSGSARTQEAVTLGHRWLTLAGDVADDLALTSDATEKLLTLWISHLDEPEQVALRAAIPGVPINARIGSRLWLGDRGALTARGTVLAVHPVTKGEHVGYRQRRVPRDGALVVIGGGTAHGVSLEAPSPVVTARQRVIAAGTGALEAVGRAKSPFVINGAQRWFAEPPHMQVSLVWLAAADGPAPRVGDQVSAEVRLTTAHFDHLVGLD